MKNDFYDKRLIILDINFHDIAQHTVDEHIWTQKLLSELTGHQNIVITTDDTSFVANKGIESLGLKAGYLISNAGATITNIANRETIDSASIDPELVIRICNFCVWNNLHFSIVTDTTQYPYNLSYWMIKKYKSDLSHLYEFKQNTLYITADIKKLAREKEIRKLEVYFLTRDKKDRYSEMMKLVALFYREIDFSINVSCLNIVSKGATKLNALNKVMKEANVDIKKDAIYCAVNQCDHQILSSVYFGLISNEVMDNLDPTDVIGAELLSIESMAWVKWFYNHEHLWYGEPGQKLKESIEKKRDFYTTQEELIALQNGKTKYLLLRKKDINKENGELMRLSFWPQQVPVATMLIKKYLLFNKKI